MYFFSIIDPMEELQSTSSITTTKWSTGEKTDNTTLLVMSVWVRVWVCVVAVTVEGWGPRCKEKSEEKQSGVED